MSAGLDTIEWVPVPGTRTEGDEVLIAFGSDGILVRNNLGEPGLALTYGDLGRVTDFALGGPDEDGETP